MYLHWAVWNRFIKSWREVIITAEIGGWDRWIKERDEIDRQRDQSICLPSIRRSRSSAFSSWEKLRQEWVVNYPRTRRIVSVKFIEDLSDGCVLYRFLWFSTWSICRMCRIFLRCRVCNFYITFYILTKIFLICFPSIN